MAQFLRNLTLAALLVFAAACGTTPEATSPSARADADVTGTVLVSGTFSGQNDHVVTGGVELIQDGDATYLRLGPDFSLDGAPDPRIGFGRSGAYDETTTFTALANTTGAQTYLLPAGFELGTLDEATIWCEDFSVPLGTARLR